MGVVPTEASLRPQASSDGYPFARFNFSAFQCCTALRSGLRLLTLVKRSGINICYAYSESI